MTGRRQLGLKGCIHKAVVRPGMLYSYGMEIVPLNKNMVKKMNGYGRDENVEMGDRTNKKGEDSE